MSSPVAGKQRVLVVDDDKAVRESLRRSLEFNGYDVSVASDGAEALAGLGAAGPMSAPDVVVMDVMMPRLDGIETTRALRAAGNDVPILVLTARDAVGDRVEGLDAGADDYLTKPFALQELLARLRALLRRATAPPGEEDEVLAFSDLSMDIATREVRRGDRADRADPHRVHAAGDVPAPAAAGARAQLHPRGGVGLRLPDHRQLARGLRRLPAPQDRGRGRAPADPHRARRRLRAEGTRDRPPRARPRRAAGTTGGRWPAGSRCSPRWPSGWR